MGKPRTIASPAMKDGMPASASTGKGRMVSDTCSAGSAQTSEPTRQRTASPPEIPGI